MRSKSQASLEYLIVIGLALLVLAGFLISSFYYSVGYHSSQVSSNIAAASSSLSSAINILSSQQVGATVPFSFISPGLTVGLSTFCSNYVVLVTAGHEIAKNVGMQVMGELPLGQGTYNGYVTLSQVNNQPAAIVKFDLPIATINSTYSLNSSKLTYNISFLSMSGSLVPNVYFTLELFGASNTLIASFNISTSSGIASGTVTLPGSYPYMSAAVVVPSFNIAGVSCISAQRLPITLVNFQPAATSAPFQQEVVVDSSAYSQFENPPLSNVQFSYPNGTIIPSWLEGGNIATFNGETASGLGGAASYIEGTSPYSFPLSAFAWVYPKSYGASNFQVIFEFDGNTVGGSQFELALQTNGQLDFWNGSTNFIASLSVPLNTWSLVGFSIDASAINIYLNGQVQSFPSSNSPTNPGAGDWIIGWQNCCGGNRDFNGSISNVQLYSSFLQQYSVGTLSSLGLGGKPLSDSNLIGWWPLAGNANDSSGNGNNGVANNVQYASPGASSTDTTYWVKLNAGMPANSQSVIDINFYPKPDSVFNNQNTGEAPQFSAVYDQYNNIGNVMSPGLMYQIYYNSSLTCDSTNYQTQLYTAEIGNNVIVPGCDYFASSTVPFTTSLQGTSQDVDGTTEPNVIINYQAGYSGGAAYPNPPVSNTGTSWLIKAIGWVSIPQSTTSTFSETSDDGITLSSGTNIGGSNGVAWLGGASSPNNLISEWHTEGATTYTSGSVSAGTYRLELDYFEDGGGSYTALWSSGAVDYYHAAYPPNGVMPSVNFGQI